MHYSFQRGSPEYHFGFPGLLSQTFVTGRRDIRRAWLGSRSLFRAPIPAGRASTSSGDHPNPFPRKATFVEVVFRLLISRLGRTTTFGYVTYRLLASSGRA